MANMHDQIDKVLEKIKTPIYFYGLAILHVLYIIVYLGVFSINTEIINYLNIIIQMFICTFLIFRFHPFRKHELHKYDGNVIFGSGVILFTNLLFTQFHYYYVKFTDNANIVLTNIKDGVGIKTPTKNVTTNNTNTSSEQVSSSKVADSNNE